MAMEYFVVGNLQTAYGESYTKLAPRWEVYAQRGYDIIDKVQKDGLLFVGINPSFDESFVGACASMVRESDNGGYDHPYFTKPRLLNDAIGQGELSHVDMFSIRTRHQYVIRDMVNDSACGEFVDKQLGLFRTIVNGACPKAIVVINAFASNLIKGGRALGTLVHNADLGVDMYRISEKRVPVFYSGMLSGAHALDNGSYERLVWHIQYVLDNM